jgi:LSD1 subclass zinc finger protein
MEQDIVFFCTCGQKLVAPDEMKGDTVPCPNCQQPVTIPSGDGGQVQDAPPAPDDAEVACPACHTPLSLPSAAQGKLVRCAKCQCDFVIGPAGETREQRVSSARQEQRDHAAKTKPAPVKAPASRPVGASGVHYPWETDPALLALVAAYDEQGAGQKYLCSGNEALNTVPRDAAVGPGAKAELWIYPDVVGVCGRTERLGCLGLLLALPALFLVGPIAFLLAIPGLIIRVILYPFNWLLAKLFVVFIKGYLGYVAEKIKRSPRSAYAIRKLLDYALLQPRFWRRGELVQLIRVNVNRFLCGRRALLLLVQDVPLQRKPGCLESVFPRLFARRRVYYVWLANGEKEADAAAAAAGEALGLSVVRGRYWRNSLKLT